MLTLIPSWISNHMCSGMKSLIYSQTSTVQMRWNYLFIPKLQRLHCSSLGIDNLFNRKFYNECNYFSMLGLNIIMLAQLRSPMQDKKIRTKPWFSGILPNLGNFYWNGSTGILARISNYIHYHMWVKITHPNFNSSLIKPPSKFGHGWWVIASHCGYNYASMS